MPRATRFTTDFRRRRVAFGIRATDFKENNFIIDFAALMLAEILRRYTLDAAAPRRDALVASFFPMSRVRAPTMTPLPPLPGSRVAPDAEDARRIDCRTRSARRATFSFRHECHQAGACSPCLNACVRGYTGISRPSFR